MHAGGRRGGRGQRLLYFFRTPPGVRVGRAAIDEDAIRLLEEHNPDVEFDWTRILKAPVPEQPVRREDRERRDRREGRGPRVPAGPRPTSPSPERPAAAFEATGRPVDREDPITETRTEALPEDAVTSAVPGGDTPESLAEPSIEAAAAAFLETTEADEPQSASLSRLGAEGLSRLRARYAEVLARIADKPMEEDARTELKRQAERLNPDTWVTADEVSEALEQYESVFESLRAVVGRHSRRRRGL